MASTLRWPLRPKDAVTLRALIPENYAPLGRDGNLSRENSLKLLYDNLYSSGSRCPELTGASIEQ